MEAKLWKILFLLLVLILLVGCSAGKGSSESNAAEITRPTVIHDTESGLTKMNVEEVYRSVLTQMLIEQLGLNDYEEELAEKGYLPVEDAVPTNLGLNFFNLKNDLFTDRLSAADQAVLEKVQMKPGNEIPSEAEEIVLNTLPHIIAPEDFAEGDNLDKLLTYYGGDELTAPRMVRIDSLVLGIATMSEYDEAGNLIDWEKDAEMEKALRAFAEETELEMTGLLGGTPIIILVDPCS